MKLVSSASMAALLLGVCAFMQSTTVFARPPCGGNPCATWWTECTQGNQTACADYKGLCSGCPTPTRSNISGMPSPKHNDTDTASVDTRRDLAVAK
jgi:hypothetical protein